jgi:hypothetical protein
VTIAIVEDDPLLSRGSDTFTKDYSSVNVSGAEAVEVRRDRG